MMMILGMFVFMRQTTPYQSLSHDSNWRHVKNDRVGKSPHYQYIGAGEDKITLSGELYPEITGGDVSLNVLQTMAYTGKAWPLIEGTGNIYGMYVITSINETRSEFFNDGKARHISFTLNLERVSEDLREMLGDVDIGLSG
ncbi:phage tail protein [Pectobacterium actinidiae]|uniref:phage tail protein n=1 Tax=Pectobacterium actinidiae TaxID=1507808 RepID=UPI002A804CD6|nr:phage tail protein [Pectobacterium actinidiae]MDY4315307.1 phage tail protein [Pectobacterium actinidiae]